MKEIYINEISAPRGTKDILPSEISKWEYIEYEFSKLCRVFGYNQIRIPTFESTELFQRGVGDTTDIVQKEMYTFNDKAGRSITLRPEGTAGVVRSYVQNGMSSMLQPVKLFYDITAFRYEKMQKGRFREFHQLGVEAFGSKEPSLDVEIISLAKTFFDRLGLTDISLNINSIGCQKCRKEYNAKLTHYLSGVINKLCATCNLRYTKNPIRILDCKEENCRHYTENAPRLIESLCEECSEHLGKVKKGLESLKISYNIDNNIVRGLDYYTKTVFEFVSHDVGTQGTVCGGGRYDNLVELFGGAKTPAAGLAMGIERLLLIIEKQNIFTGASKKADIFIATVGEEASRFAEKLVYNMRLKEIYAEKDLTGRSLKAQMKYADKLGASLALVIGEDEIRSGKATIKSMKMEIEPWTVDLKNMCYLVENIKNILSQINDNNTFCKSQLFMDSGY